MLGTEGIPHGEIIVISKAGSMFDLLAACKARITSAYVAIRSRVEKGVIKCGVEDSPRRNIVFHVDAAESLIPCCLSLIADRVEVPGRNFGMEISACFFHADKGSADAYDDGVSLHQSREAHIGAEAGPVTRRRHRLRCGRRAADRGHHPGNVCHPQG